MNAATLSSAVSGTRAAPPSRQLLLAHGGGGQLTDQLLADCILPRLMNPALRSLGDAAILSPSWQDRPAMTIDAYVVQPWRFPGGDIGRLAVCGTVNDLAVAGAEPRALALSLILAEGFDIADLATVMDSIARAAEQAGVRVVTGDTKVVGHDQADGLYITTAGVGSVPFASSVQIERVRPGDVLLINGPIGEHGLAIMLAREMPDVHSALRSDAQPLNHLIHRCMQRLGDGLVWMRDPTRSGLAGVVSDLARLTGRHVTLHEDAIPISPQTRHAADMLGLDPLEVANEGKVVMVVRREAASRALAVLQESGDVGGGPEASIIGTVGVVRDGLCELHTGIGGRRIVQKPYGEQLPRIC